MPRTRKPKPQVAKRRETLRTRKPVCWIIGARKYLHKLAKKVRADGHLEEAYDLQFASRMILDCWNIGEPGLAVGMFYTPDWRSWRDITEQHPAKVVEPMEDW